MIDPKQHEESNLPQNALLSTGGGRGRLEFHTGRERYLGHPHRHSLLARVYGMAVGRAGYGTTKKCPDNDARERSSGLAVDGRYALEGIAVAPILGNA